MGQGLGLLTGFLEDSPTEMVRMCHPDAILPQTPSALGLSQLYASSEIRSAQLPCRVCQEAPPPVHSMPGKDLVFLTATPTFLQPPPFLAVNCQCALLRNLLKVLLGVTGHSPLLCLSSLTSQRVFPFRYLNLISSCLQH